MPLEFLRQLAQRDQFPAVVTDESDIDKLRVLRAAGMVQATLPDGPGQGAQVTAITGMGHASLRAQRAREVLALRERELKDRHLA
jgi:hypothetical protein